MTGSPVYVDAATMLTLLERDAPDHNVAKTMLDISLHARRALISTNYDVVRASLLAQDRHGQAGVELLLRSLAPLLRIQWCSSEEHAAAVEMLLVSPGSERDLVTALGNLIMRRRDIRPLLRTTQEAG